MLCDICGKKEASVHITEIIDNKMTELHLCEECAHKKEASIEHPFSLADLLGGLTDLDAILEPTKVAQKKCPGCGLGYSDFKKMGRFGCSQCYQTFKEALEPLLKRIHGSNHHLGKFPVKRVKKAKAQLELDNLRAELQKAIQLEEYEEAIKLRDQIRDLEKGRKNKR
ncbi:MAG: UvrB/UvrC motif-containing protein [Candidatus Omnitrophota bacterium]|nr:UvrB/UvrC motif-containing protein [Candidatus Omnitrophota bacterium]